MHVEKRVADSQPRRERTATMGRVVSWSRGSATPESCEGRGDFKFGTNPEIVTSKHWRLDVGK